MWRDCNDREQLLDVQWLMSLLAALNWLANLDNVETRRQGLLQLLGFLLVIDDKRVEEARAADLELGHHLAVGLSGLLDASRRGVFSASNLEEVLDIGDLLGLHEKR